MVVSRREDLVVCFLIPLFREGAVTPSVFLDGRNFLP